MSSDRRERLQWTGNMMLLSKSDKVVSSLELAQTQALKTMPS